MWNFKGRNQWYKKILNTENNRSFQTSLSYITIKGRIMILNYKECNINVYNMFVSLYICTCAHACTYTNDDCAVTSVSLFSCVNRSSCAASNFSKSSCFFSSSSTESSESCTIWTISHITYVHNYQMYAGVLLAAAIDSCTCNIIVHVMH